MDRSTKPQPPPQGTTEAAQVRAALLELLGDDLVLALELIAASDDERGLRTLLGSTRQVVPGRSKRAKPAKQLGRACTRGRPRAAHQGAAAARPCLPRRCSLSSAGLREDRQAGD